jgi:hypothetical protein
MSAGLPQDQRAGVAETNFRSSRLRLEPHACQDPGESRIASQWIEHRLDRDEHERQITGLK